MNAILILFHCESNTGYAIGKLEPIFFEMARALCNGDLSRIHFAYPSMARGKPQTLPAHFSQYLLLDAAHPSPEDCARVEAYLRTHRIDTVFGFDQPVHRSIYKYFRKGGVTQFVSYWGAPMSSIFGPFKRLLKRIDVLLHPDGPNHYIFESQGMADTATLGRGIPATRVHIAYLGVNTERFKPNAADHHCVYQRLAIPAERKIFFYSGHMEPRKGVATIMRAANRLVKQRRADDWHILLLGNKATEADWLLDLLDDETKSRITFGGYRDDIETLHRGCYAGIIASTGWDSLTCSSIEMQASGLPLVLSALPGLREAVEHNVSGLLFPPGDDAALATTMENLLDNPDLQQRLAIGARSRVESSFSESHQLKKLISIMQQL